MHSTRKLSGFKRLHSNLDAISTAVWVLQFDEIVVGSIGGEEERTCVLEVLQLGVALERFLNRLVVPVCEQDATVAMRSMCFDAM